MTVDFLRDNNLIIFETISGSYAYGTNTENSDTDIRGVFVLPHDYVLGNKYIEQVSDETNDVVFYEIRRFLELLQVNNPNILELLNAPEDCIQYKHPAFDIILKNKDNFISKKCGPSFGGYAISQIKKAEGMDKMQNWEKDRVERKGPIDFCYVIDEGKSYPLRDYLELNRYEQKFCGVSSVPNSRDIYALFYDITAHNCFSETISEKQRENLKSFLTSRGRSFGLGYKGLEKEGDENSNTPESNSLRLSSIPKDEKCLAIFSYNKDGYTAHCRDYKNYQDWTKKANRQRWVDVKNHGQKIDGKNLMHCKRLITMAVEIATGKGIIVRRPDAQELLKIRKGEVALQDLLDWAKQETKVLDELFKNSNFPDEIDSNFIHDLIVKIRKEVYK